MFKPKFDTVNALHAEIRRMIPRQDQCEWLIEWAHLHVPTVEILHPDHARTIVELAREYRAQGRNKPMSRAVSRLIGREA